MKNYAKFTALLLLSVVAVVGLFTPIRTQTPQIAQGLPVYQAFQLVSPNGMGAVMSNGISTSTLSASSTPTFAGITATSTIRLTNASNGCAQFTGGLLLSVGTNCPSSSGGLQIDYVAATSTIVTDYPSVTMPAATTTSVTTGGRLDISATCNVFQASGADFYLDVGNPGGGTTTLHVVRANTAANNIGPVYLQGVYVSTTTGRTLIALDSAMGTTISTQCRGSSIKYTRYTN